MAAESQLQLLHVQIVEGRRLAAMDLNGKSDPYVKLRLTQSARSAKNKPQTTTKKATLSPVWCEAFSFVVETVRGESLQLKVRDADAVGKDDHIGEVEYPLDFLDTQADTDPNGHAQVEAVLDVKLPGKSEHRGSILVRIVLEKQASAVALEQAEAKKASALFLDHRRTLFHRQFEEAARGDSERQLLVFTGTWNVGNEPPSEDLSEWLGERGQEKYHLIAIGTQECEYAPRSPHSSCDEDWKHCLASHFGEDKYAMVAHYSLMEMRLTVFARADVAHLVSDVRTDREATGVAGVVGNKGGVVVSLSVLDTSYCFVNSHLAAHQGQSAARDANMREIMQGVRLGLDERLDLAHAFAHVFWMGDLNYRLDYGGEAGQAKTPPPELHAEMVARIRANELAELFEHDQLTKSFKSGDAWAGFHEGEYHFPPTFKVLRRREMEDGQFLEYKPQRSPAWCDRVLWRSWNSVTSRQTELRAAVDIDSSDHKPVAAAFETQVVRHSVPFVDSIGNAVITLRSVVGKNLHAADANGKSDPYLKLFGDALVKSQRSVWKSATLSPEWADEDIPACPLRYNNPSRLQQSVLHVRVSDHDFVGSNDLMGLGTLHLCDCLAAAGPDGNVVDHPFEIELERYGQRAGSIAGVISITYDKSDYAEQTI